MRNANHAWTTLSEIEKEEYKKKASKVEITKFEDLDQEGQSSMIDGTRKEIQKLVSNFILKKTNFPHFYYDNFKISISSFSSQKK